MTKGAADNLAKQMANLASGTDDAAAASRLVIKVKTLGPALSTALANSADDLARGGSQLAISLPTLRALAA